jgi:hypothetical protein
MKNMIIFFLGVWAIAATWWATYMTKHTNLIREEMDRLRREKDKAPSLQWTVMVKIKGQKKPQAFRLTASDEGDVVRQLLNRRVQPRDIMSIIRTPNDPSMLGPVPTA